MTLTKHYNATIEDRWETLRHIDHGVFGRDSGADLLDRLCRYIRSHLDATITLDDLARRAGRTTRCIQYAFRHRFGCSPTEWIRSERLTLARERLLRGAAGATVCDIAFASGFNHLSMFARYYRERFHEAPSATLARAAGKVHTAVRCPAARAVAF